MTNEQDLTALVAVLRRKNQRERQARELAERQLEEFSRELYETNQSLQRSLNTARKHEVELAYLNQASQHLSAKSSLSSLLKNTTEITGKFTGSALASFFFTLEGQVLNPHKAAVWRHSQGWNKEPELLRQMIAQIPIDQPSAIQGWCARPFKMAQTQRLFFINLPLLDGRLLWFVLANNKTDLGDGAMVVLDTVRGQVLSAVQKGLADEQRDKQHQQLASTQDDLQNLQRQLMQSDRMASLGHLAAGVAHEVNNPLGFITSNMHVLQEYLEEFDSFFQQLATLIQQPDQHTGAQIHQLMKNADLAFLRQDAQDIVTTNLQGLSRVADIVKSLKTFSYAADDQFRPVDLVDICGQALKVVHNQLKYNFNVSQHLPETMPAVLGNPGQLQQVMVNLLINAVQAMASGGDIDISAKVTAEQIHLAFTDSGPGMDANTQEKLFTPFFTTKEVGVGSGLGLSISHSIMEAHQGQILVRSAPGKGACFTLVFPIIVE